MVRLVWWNIDFQLRYNMKFRLQVDFRVEDKLVFFKEHDALLKNWIDMLFLSQYGGDPSPDFWTISMTDTSNTARSQGSYRPFRIDCAAGVSAYGLVVGTGTNAVTLTDYKLQTQIAHGNGAGQLAYGAGSFVAPTTSGSDRYWDAVRTFTNNSGGDITINEVGIYAFSSNPYYYCIARDLTGGVLIANTKVATLTYRFKISV